jgi:hypothetical protein
MSGRLFFVTCVIALTAVVGSSAALATPNPKLTRLQKTLRANIVGAFKKEAPEMKITVVACTIPVKGAPARCTAHFKANGGTGFYPVMATYSSNGTLRRWATTGRPTCFGAAGVEQSC